MRENFTEDVVIAQFNKREYEMEMEERKRKRRSNGNSPDELFALRDTEAREEGDILLYEDSPIAGYCELIVGERSSGGLIRPLEEEKREGVAALLEMFSKGGLRPVKISDWAMESDVDEYYLVTHAREACNALPRGIVKMNRGDFVMGDALTQYANLYKTIYAHEVVAILDEEEKKNEKEIATNLGIASLEGLLKMKTITDVFYVEKKNGELSISMRA